MDIQSFIKTYDFKGRQYSQNADILKQGTFIVRKGSYIQRNNMINV
jgi:hypothetical protein